MPSFDINAILSAALATAVAEATKPLLARIEALENNPAIGVDTVLAARVVALETKLTEAALFEKNTNVTIPIDEAKMVAALNSQEWFWHKVAGFITNNSEVTANDLEILKDRVDALESRSDASGLSRRAVEALIEQTMDHHLECYDHDNYDDIASKVDDMPDADELVSKESLSEAVRDAVQDLSFEVRVR